MLYINDHNLHYLHESFLSEGTIKFHAYFKSFEYTKRLRITNSAKKTKSWHFGGRDYVTGVFDHIDFFLMSQEEQNKKPVPFETLDE